MSLYRTNAKYDPTRTLVLRRQYEAEMARRFKKLMKLAVAKLVDENALGLSTNAFEYTRSPQKIATFLKWLKSQSDLTILDGIDAGAAASKSWQNIYISSAYQKGIASAAGNMRKSGAEISDRYIKSAFFQPVHADRAGLIYTRAFSELEGVTGAMSTRIGRSLAKGIIEGRSMMDMADQLVEDVSSIGLTRARLIARTEVISAHAEASLNTYEEAQAEGVELQSEFSTARDDQVCVECEKLEGKVFSVEEARGVIPIHPNCRCAWLPVVSNPKTIKLL